MKLLILILIGYLGYRAVKNWMAKSPAFRQAMSSGGAGEIDDIMVKDPSCGVYFPKRDGVHLRYDGEDFYFCSEACRNRFVSEKDNRN